METDLVASMVTSMLYIYTTDPNEHQSAFDFAKEHIGEDAAIEQADKIMAFGSELSIKEFSFLVLTVMEPLLPVLTYLTVSDFALLSEAARVFSEELNRLDE